MSAIASGAARGRRRDQGSGGGRRSSRTCARPPRASQTNDWSPADEAWAKMNVDNSKWYVRVAPDETYWEPCARKAGFHLTFARINQALEGVAGEARAGAAGDGGSRSRGARARRTRRARSRSTCRTSSTSSINAGDDRDPLGATIGQSLPNWGPVANEGRGRTVAMIEPLHRPGQPGRAPRAGREHARRGEHEALRRHAGAGPALDDPPRGDAQPRPGARVQGRAARPTTRCSAARSRR